MRATFKIAMTAVLLEFGTGKGMNAFTIIKFRQEDKIAMQKGDPNQSIGINASFRSPLGLRRVQAAFRGSFGPAGQGLDTLQIARFSTISTCGGKDFLMIPFLPGSRTFNNPP